jgi:hypothetical protein
MLVSGRLPKATAVLEFIFGHADSVALSLASPEILMTLDIRRSANQMCHIPPNHDAEELAYERADGIVAGVGMLRSAGRLQDEPLFWNAGDELMDQTRFADSGRADNGLCATVPRSCAIQQFLEEI